ncbi:hypothetical protein [Streptococcus ferus]
MAIFNFLFTKKQPEPQLRPWRNRHYGEQLWQAHHEARKTEGKSMEKLN